MRIRSSVIPGLLLCAITLSTFAQDDAPLIPWPAEVSSAPFKELESRGYLAAVLGLLDRESTVADLGDAQSMYHDFLGTLLPWVGEHARGRATQATMLDLLNPGSRPKGPRPDFAGYHAEPAVKACLALAKGQRVAMWNEEHLSSRERAFMHSLLAGLRQDGFTHLACETLAHDDPIATRGYPIPTSGYYSKDPVFGDLLRRALELGFILVPYEATSEQLRPRESDTGPVAATNRRELAQADNLATILSDPADRVVVFAGRHHISEASADWTPMAGVLKRRHGIDPVTMDLIVMTEHSRPIDDHPAWLGALDAKLVTTEPVVLMDEQGAPFTSMPGGIDAMVFFPRTDWSDERPQWLALDGLRRHVVAPGIDVSAIDQPLLLQAMFEGESDAAIPADQVVLWPEKPIPQLFLRRGSYRLRLVERQGTDVWTDALKVE